MFNYEQEFQIYKLNTMKKNRERIIKEIDTPDTKEKINNFIELCNDEFTYEEVRNEILNNPMFAAKMAIAPSRQSLEQAFTLQKIGVKKPLPSQGRNCIRFDLDGNIVHIKEEGKTTKSVDCIYKGIYTTLKCTHKKGGSQNNQEEEVINWLRLGSKKNKVGAIVDGNYYTKEVILRMRNLFKDNPNVVFITSTEEIINGAL